MNLALATRSSVQTSRNLSAAITLGRPACRRESVRVNAGVNEAVGDLLSIFSNYSSRFGAVRRSSNMLRCGQNGSGQMNQDNSYGGTLDMRS